MTFLLSTEEAVDQIVEALTSNSPMINPRSPASSTLSRRSSELPFRPTPETPTPSNVRLPTKSRFWPRDDKVTRGEEQEGPLTSASSDTNVLGSPSLDELAEPERDEELENPKELEGPPPCKGTLWGLPCFWCKKDGSIKSDNEQYVAIEGDGNESSNQLTGDSPPATSVQDVHEQCLDERLPDDSQFANSTVLPGLCTPETLPPILYRWSNAHSQGINSPTLIVCGKFARPDSIAFSPTVCDIATLLDYVKSHLTKAPMSSPFISAFKSLLAPIHRGLRNRRGAIISVIDTSQVTTEVFKAVPLVLLTDTALRNWHGYGEFLIWGKVSAPAIACSFTIERLEEIASTHPNIGQFLQLGRIQERRLCSRFLYSDLAANVPPSQDGYAGLSDRLTDLLGMQGKVKELVAREFKQAWTEKFCNLKYQKPEERSPIPSGLGQQEVDLDLDLDLELELELNLELAASAVSSGRRSRKLSPTASESSYQPPTSESDDDSGSSTSGPEDSVGSEEVAKCPRCDTSSENFSVDDDSSEGDWRQHSPVDDEDVEMTEVNWGSDDEWPSDEATPDDVLVHWGT